MSQAADTTFDRVLTEYGPVLARMAAAYAEDDADTQDLLQEILIAVWRALPRFRRDASERTFVLRIGYNRAMTHVARRRRHAPLESVRELADPRPDPAETAAHSERHARLLSAVRQIPEPQRRTVLLSLEGLTHREIAEVLGTTENNVAVRLTRGRASLRRLLGSLDAVS